MKSVHKPKILLVHNYYQIQGGEDTVVANEKKLLENHGHEVMLYTRHNSELKKFNIVRKLALPFTTIFNPRTYKDIKGIIERESIDIVHVHNTLNLISPAVYYAAVKCGVPVVQTVHNFRLLCPGATFYRDGHICEECVNKGLLSAVRHRCYRGSRIETLICAVSTHIHRVTGILGKINYIALTQFNKEKLLQNKRIDPDRVFIKPNFTFLADDGYPWEKDNFYIFIGRIEELKGVDLLTDAFIKMKDKRLKIAGDGPLMEKLREKCSSSGSNNIEFLGRIDHSELMKEIKKAKAVIVTSQCYEGFPMAMVEAFSTGTPVIGGNIGNVGDLIEDGITGLKFTYNSSDSLIDAVNKYELIEDKDFHNRIKDRFEREYSVEINYAKLDRIYNCILAWDN